MFEKCGVYLSVSINLVICGAIVYYFHKKVNSLEIALMKQSQLFSSFIQDFQRDMNRVNYNHNPSSTNTLASPEAIIAVSKLNFDGSSVVNNNNKIEVSDDSESSESSESSDSDDSDDSDGSECDVDESGCEIVDISDSIDKNENENDSKRIHLSDFEVVDDNLNIESMDLNSMDLGGLSNQEVFEMMTSQHHCGVSGGFVVINGMPMMMNMDNMDNINNTSSSYIEEIKDEQETKIIILNNDDDDSTDEDDSDDEEEEEEKKPVIKKQSSNPKKVSNKKNIIMMDIHDLSNTDINEVKEEVKEEVKIVKKEVVKKEEKPENMKIDDLRKLVNDKNLASKENVKKMKKPELLQLLLEKTTF
jgi:hypothetical protein